MSTALYFVTAALCSIFALLALRQRKNIFVFWLIISYYSIIGVNLSLNNGQGLPQHYVVGMGLFQATEPAWLHLQFCIAVSIGYFLADLLSKRLFGSTGAARSVTVDVLSFQIISVVTISCAIGAIVLLSANSYAEYLEGSIGWSTALAIISCIGVSASICARRAGLLYRALPVSAALAATIYITMSTGVRSLLIVSIGTGLLAMSMSGVIGRYPKTVGSSAIAVSLLLYFTNALVFAPARGGDMNFLLPETVVVSYYIGLEPLIQNGHETVFAPIHRFVIGLLSWPSSRIGIDLEMPTEAAYEFAPIVNPYFRWYEHYPSLTALDLKYSVGQLAPIAALLVGVFFALIETVSRHSRMLNLFLAPSIFIVFFYIARGTFLHAGETISFVLPASLVFFGAVLFTRTVLSRT